MKTSRLADAIIVKRWPASNEGARMGVHIGIDYGGTQLRIAEVDPETGEMGELIKLDSQQLTSNAILSDAVRAHIPAGARVGISAAGVIDGARACIVQAPNSAITGEITLGSDLRAAGHEVVMINDIRAATQGEAWFGPGNRDKAIAVATYSTGFNCAFAKTGRVSSRQTEVGHALYHGGMSLPCGCGGLDHLESYVSGGGAAALAHRLLTGRSSDNVLLRLALARCNQQRRQTWQVENLAQEAVRHEVLNFIDAALVYQAYRQDPFGQPQHQIRDIQCRAIAVSLSQMIHYYNPLDRIILMGSQTKDWDILFKPAIAEVFDGGMMPSLKHPEIIKVCLPEPGVQGAVAALLAKD